jgi:hypothetical protein
MDFSSLEWRNIAKANTEVIVVELSSSIIFSAETPTSVSGLKINKKTNKVRNICEK